MGAVSGRALLRGKGQGGKKMERQGGEQKEWKERRGRIRIEDKVRPESKFSTLGRSF